MIKWEKEYQIWGYGRYKILIDTVGDRETAENILLQPDFYWHPEKLKGYIFIQIVERFIAVDYD